LTGQQLKEQMEDKNNGKCEAKDAVDLKNNGRKSRPAYYRQGFQHVNNTETFIGGGKAGKTPEGKDSDMSEGKWRGSSRVGNCPKVRGSVSKKTRSEGGRL